MKREMHKSSHAGSLVLLICSEQGTDSLPVVKFCPMTGRLFDWAEDSWLHYRLLVGRCHSITIMRGEQDLVCDYARG